MGRKPERFEAVLTKIKANGVKSEPLIVLADISIDYERIIKETIDKYRRLDVLINNAAFNIPGSIENTKVEDFDSVMATNVRGTFLLTHLAIPHLIATKGNIVNVSSVAGQRPFPSSIAYCTSKAALDHFTRCVALELAGKGVRANVVSPGVIDTNFRDYLGMDRDDEKYATLLKNLADVHPVGRVGEPDECVNAIAFLANENAAFITGVILPCDGNLSIYNYFIRFLHLL